MVKLYVYTHPKTKETIVDIYSAQGWEDFLFVEVGGDEDPEALMRLKESIEASNLPNMYPHIILITKGTEVEFYGIREEENGSED